MHHEYAVYSYDISDSKKKGHVWRQHGVSNNKQEAEWIADQLKTCHQIERIEIRLQGINSKTNRSVDKTIKIIDKTKTGFVGALMKLFPLFS